MVIDTSALVAILLQESDASRFAEAISGDPVRLLSAAALLETSLVIENRKGEDGRRALDELIHRTEIEIVPFTAEQAEIARRAFRAFGRGRHPAGLNFGDCFAYALAKSSGERLLFKGNDFHRTDVTPA